MDPKSRKQAGSDPSPYLTGRAQTHTEDDTSHYAQPQLNDSVVLP